MRITLLVVRGYPPTLDQIRKADILEAYQDRIPVAPESIRLQGLWHLRQQYRTQNQTHFVLVQKKSPRG